MSRAWEDSLLSPGLSSAVSMFLGTVFCDFVLLPAWHTVPPWAQEPQVFPYSCLKGQLEPQEGSFSAPLGI